MKATGRTWTVAYCLSLFMALTLLASDYVWAPVRYRLGAGDTIDFSTVTKANQGGGSGLDADMLDGKEGSEYLTGSSSPENTFTIGDGNNTDKYYRFDKGGSNLPGIRWNAQNARVQVSHDGTTYQDISAGGGGTTTVEEGDTQKVASASTLDFSAGDFAVTESPTGEANIALEDAVRFSGKTTDDLTEGSTNLYHTDARFDTRLGTKTTDDLTEGSGNKYNPFGASIDSAEITDGTITSSDINATSDLNNNARLAVRKNTGGSDVGERRRLNLIEGTNVTLTIADDPANEEVDVTIASSGGGGSGGDNNLVRNGSFESWSAGTSNQAPDGWSKIGTPTDVSRDTGERDNFGNPYAVKITSAGAGNEGVSLTFSNLRASTTYAVRVRAKATSGDTAKIWTTGAGTNLSETTTSTSWATLSGTFITDATPTDAVLKLGSDTSGDIVWFDALSIIEGSTAPVWFSPHPNDQHLKAIDYQDNSPTNYDYGLLRQECGRVQHVVSSTWASNVTVTFGTAFSKILVVLQVSGAGNHFFPLCQSVTNSSFNAVVIEGQHTNVTETFDSYWIAIGVD